MLIKYEYHFVAGCVIVWRYPQYCGNVQTVFHKAHNSFLTLSFDAVTNAPATGDGQMQDGWVNLAKEIWGEPFLPSFALPGGNV